MTQLIEQERQQDVGLTVQREYQRQLLVNAGKEIAGRGLQAASIKVQNNVTIDYLGSLLGVHERDLNVPGLQERLPQGSYQREVAQNLYNQLTASAPYRVI